MLDVDADMSERVPSMTADQQQIFISYQRTDSEFARQVRQHLVAAGMRAWMDQFDIPVGAYWPDAIDAALTSADIVVGILTPDAVASRNVKNEWDWAIQNDKKLLLLQIKPTAIPHRYVSINFIDASGLDPAPAFTALLNAVGVRAEEADVFVPPETRYARSGDVNIAYQVLGNGPLDVVLVPGFISNIEVEWEWPEWAHDRRRLATRCRLIRFDKRGTGLSDRVADAPPLDQRMDDVRTVMDAVGSNRAVIMGISEGGPMSVLFAATYPERTIALILWGAMVKGTASADYPWSPTTEQNEAYFARLLSNWGTGEPLFDVSPNRATDQDFQRWFARYQRLSASPGGAVAFERLNAEIDVRHVLPSIRVPTLILHRTSDPVVNVGEGRYLATHIPDARFVEFSGVDHVIWADDHDRIFAEIDRFLASIQSVSDPNTVLTTVLALDVADSGGTDPSDPFPTAIERELTEQRGHVVRQIGETVLATFDGPTRAVRCAVAIRDAADERGISVRGALHTGEVELRGDTVTGAPVQIAEQLLAEARTDEILVSSTVTHLVAGSGFSFTERGGHVMVGMPDEWRIYAVD
jgi:pimeloyl-ACP methyl ester carboxylesterase